MNAILSDTPVLLRPDELATNLAPSSPVTHDSGRRLQEWIAQIESLPDPASRDLFLNCLQSILALHRDGLARILYLLRNSGAAGGEVASSLSQDKLVHSLLLIHDLHPVPLETRLLDALDKLRPFIKDHGADVELVALENDNAQLRLTGLSWPRLPWSSPMEMALRQAINEACPDLAGFTLDNAAEPATAME